LRVGKLSLGRLLDAYAQNVEILKGQAAESKKAVALWWILHLVGDVHQPLHSVTYQSTQFPQGDRGGSRFYIKARQEANTISLHKFWDDLITSTPRFRETLNLATELRNRPAFARSAYPQLAASDFKAWALESYGLAAKKAYLNGDLQSGQSKEEGVVLPATYAKEAKAVAERQVVLASYRMSDLLASLF
jgi:hypothetical protein